MVRDAQKHLLSTQAAHGCLLPPLLHFPHTIGCVSQDEYVKLHKLTDAAAVVWLITDDESLYIASDGSAVERYSIRNNLLFLLNRSSNKKETVTPGEK